MFPALKVSKVEVRVKEEKAIKREVLFEKIEDFDLNERQEKALEFVVDHQRIDNSIYREICDAMKRTATRDLTDLVNVGLLEKHGEKKGTYYTLRLFKEQK